VTELNWGEAAGYLASALVFSTFSMKSMVALRCTAIASNAAFIAYGLAGGLRPVLILHLALLPLNLLRLHQLCRPRAAGRAAFAHSGAGEVRLAHLGPQPRAGGGPGG